MTLSFGQKLLIAVGVLILVITAALTFTSDYRLQTTTNAYVDSILDEAVDQSKASIADWLNTRLRLSEAMAQALKPVDDVDTARNLLGAMTDGSGSLNVYVGTKDGGMFMRDEQTEGTLPDDFDPRKRPWYQASVSEQEASFTSTYQDASTGGMIVSATAPVSSGTFEGAVGMDIGLGEIQELLSSITLSGAGYAVLVDNDGTVLFHPEKDLVGSNVKDVLGFKPTMDGEERTFQRDGDTWSVAFFPISEARSVKWHLGTVVNSDKIHQPVIHARITGLTIAAVGLLIALIVLHFAIRGLMTPVRRLNAALSDIASGDADLTQRLDDTAGDEFGELAGSFNRFVENIRQVIKEVEAGSKELYENVSSLRETSRNSRDSVEGQQNEIDMIATAINEMSAAAGEIAQNAQQTAEAAETANTESQGSLTTVTASRDAVRQLSHEVNSAAEVIDALGKDVASITTVLEVIQDVAEQTNLLALNAAIEAARAGEAGRGFAVVADEVRNLAQRTQASTEEINDMIERLQKGADNAVDVMKESTAVSNVSMEKAQDAMDSLNRIVEGINQISQMTSQIATASEEQTSVTDELNSSITRIADQGQDAAKAASENDVYSGHIETIGQKLHEKVRRFRV